MEDEDDELDPALADRIAEFFYGAEETVEAFDRTRDPRAMFALAEDWLQASRSGPSPTAFGGIVTLATFAQQGFDAGAPPSYLCLAIAAWRAMTLDPRFKDAEKLSRAVTWNNLACALVDRLTKGTTQPDDIDDAVAAQREAVAALPPDAPNYFQYYAQLSLCLWRRHKLDGDEQDLKESTQVLEQWRAREQDPVRQARAARGLIVAAARADNPTLLKSALGDMQALLSRDAKSARLPERHALALIRAIEATAYVAPSTTTLDVLEQAMLQNNDAAAVSAEVQAALDDCVALIGGLRVVRRASPMDGGRGTAPAN